MSNYLARFDADEGVRERCRHMGIRLDAETPGPSAYIERALHYLRKQVYETKIPPLKGRTFVRMSTDVPKGAKTFGIPVLTRRGVARWYAGGGTDIPRSDYDVKEITFSVHQLVAGYGYSIFDLAAAGFAEANGLPISLSQQKQQAAFQAINKGLDNVARNGTADGTNAPPGQGWYGFVNQPNATTYAIPNGANNSQAWSSKTPDEIAKDILGAETAMISTTYETFMPDTVALPLSQLGYIRTTRMGDGSDMSIHDYVLSRAQYIKRIEGWSYLAGAGSGGSDRMVVYDSQQVEQPVPTLYEEMPPDIDGFEISINCYAETGPVVLLATPAFMYADHI